MPVTPTYPGVYIEEISSGVRTIAGVSTSVAAFVDQFRSGPVNEPVQLFGFGDFEREFGGLDDASEASYAIQQFFLNGGGEAWAVRVVRAEGANAARKSSVTIGNQVGGSAALTVTAISEGEWGNNLRARIEWQPIIQGETAHRFNLTTTEYNTDGRTIVRQEVFRNLLPNDSAATIVNDPVTGSKLVNITIPPPGTLPAVSGTISDPIDIEALKNVDGGKVSVTITDANDSVTADARVAWAKSPALTLLKVAEVLQAGIRAARPDLPTFGGTTVQAIDNQLWVLPGGRAATRKIEFHTIGSGVDPTADLLRLATSARTVGTAISGPLGETVTLQPTQTFLVGIDDPANPVQATMNGPEGLVAEGPVPREQLPALLEAAIRAVPDQSPAFTQATVTLIGDRLHVRSGSETSPAPIFANDGDNGTANDVLNLVENAQRHLITLSGTHQIPPTITGNRVIAVKIGSADPVEAPVNFDNQTTYAAIATVLQAAIQTLPGGAGATVSVIAQGTSGTFMITPAAEDVPITVDNIDDLTADALKLASTGIQPNIAEYQLGVDANTTSAQIAITSGSNGGEITTNDLIGSPADKTGIFALEKVDLFNILCIPRFGKLTGSEATMLANTAIAYCERRRAFFLVDTPEGVDDQREIKAWLATSGLSVSANAAIYYPRVKVADPLADFRLRSRGASGTMAGIYARTDASRGVWKAPAGTEANLRNVNQLDAVLTDAENGALNPLGINCLRTFPVFGNIAWGARTLQGADQLASEWKYVPVRRLALFLEESLYRGTKWVVFEPNDEPLWAQIHLNIGAFMQNLFRQGAFQGGSPREAYFVKCDKETTTQADINLGIVNIVVGFAPLKPAEFVIIKFQQMAGQLQV